MTEFENLSIMTGAVTETHSLKETVYSILSLVDRHDLKEIIIAYSPDISSESRKALDELAAAQTEVPIIIFGQSRPGLSAAIQEAIDRCSGTHCMVVAADLAENLDVIPDLIKCVKEDSNVIATTSRRLKGCTFYGYNPIRKKLNSLAQVFLRVLFGSRLTDLTNPVQIVPTELYQSINYESTGYTILLELMLKPLRLKKVLGYTFKEFPVNCYARKDGKSGNSFINTLAYLPMALHIRFMKKERLLKKDTALYKEFFEKKQ